MDFNNDNELDYEEDDLEDDYAKNVSQNKCNTEDKVHEDKDSNVSGLDDQYLQIDFSEEEENLISGEVPAKTVSCENQNIGKAKDKIEVDEKIENSQEQNFFSRKKRFTRNNENVNNHNDGYDGGTVKVEKKTHLAPCRRQREFKTKTKTPVGRNRVKNPRNSSYDDKIPSLNLDFNSNRKSAFTLPNLDIKQQEQNSQHIRNINKTFPNYFRFPFDSVTTKFSVGSKKIFAGNVRHKKIKRRFQNGNITRTSTFDENSNISTTNNKKSFEEFQVTETSEDLPQRVFCDQKANSVADAQVEFSNFGIRNNDGTDGNGFLDAGYYSLPEDEKKLAELKKEARLKRFVHDDLVWREGTSIGKNEIDSSSEERSIRERYSRKLEGQKLILKGQQKSTSIFDNGRGDLRKEKPYINKESLLKKINPFHKNLETSVYAPGTKIKCLESKTLTPFTAQRELPEEGNVSTLRDSFARGIYVDKCDAYSRVKFVRTVSKSFDELVLKPRHESQFSHFSKSLPFTQPNKRSCTNGDFAQVESQLTGCIVKVLNVSPSTTTNDVLGLCDPIGKVLEVKLNFPKENSVVIRFAESDCADKFFSFYHGRKMNDYFLNVIVV